MRIYLLVEGCAAPSLLQTGKFASRISICNKCSMRIPSKHMQNA